MVWLSAQTENFCISDGDGEPSEVHIGRLLQILREFSDDPVLSAYVIDDIWDDMKAVKVRFFYYYFPFFSFLWSIHLLYDKAKKNYQQINTRLIVCAFAYLWDGTMGVVGFYFLVFWYFDSFLFA